MISLLFMNSSEIHGFMTLIFAFFFLLSRATERVDSALGGAKGIVS